MLTHMEVLRATAYLFFVLWPYFFGYYLLTVIPLFIALSGISRLRKVIYGILWLVSPFFLLAAVIFAK